jgi:hypothetical protein
VFWDYTVLSVPKPFEVWKIVLDFRQNFNLLEMISILGERFRFLVP